MKLVAKNNVLELNYKVREGILAAKVNPNEIDENNRYIVNVLYKPTDNYGVKFSIGGLCVDDLDQVSIDNAVESIYNANIYMILDIIADIYNNTYEFCGADIENLMQYEEIRDYVENI